MTTLLAIISAAALWMYLWVVFTGIGMLVRRALGHRLEALEDLLVLPWLGWGGVVAFLQFWHRASPIDGQALAFVSAVGLVGVAVNARPLARLLTPRWREAVVACGVMGLAGLWLANHTVMQPAIFDSGFYYLNAVRWAKEFPLITGLGNLHDRLAFNNSSFLYTAMLDTGRFAQRSHQVASGFLMWLLLINGLHGVLRLWRDRRGGELSIPYYALCVVPLLAWIVNTGYASSPAPDVPCFVLAVVLGGELLRLLSPRTPARGFEPFAGICLLAMVGITVTLSFAAIAVAAALLATAVQAWRVRTLDRVVAALTLVVSLGLLILVPWTIRGVELSGYPAYPDTIGQAPVEWALPVEGARRMAEGVKAWARMPQVPPETVLHGWDWLGPWCRRVWWSNRLEFTLPMVLTAGALVFAGWRIRLRLVPPDLRFLVLLPPIAGLGVWFLAAPDPRFQGALSWVLANSLLVLVLPSTRRVRLGALAAQGLLVLALCTNPIDFIRTWKDPGPAREVAMKKMVTRSGLAVYVPVTGDQSWNSPLPATPYFSPRLRLRETDNMAQGFTKSVTATPEEALR